MISAPIITGLKDNTMLTEIYCIVLSVSGYQFLSSLTVCKALTSIIKKIYVSGRISIFVIKIYAF